MKRIAGGMILCAFAIGALSAQTREAYQQAYREWRQSDSNLEQEAATAGDKLVPRTEKAAADAGKFVAQRKAFYETQRAQLADELKALQPMDLVMDVESAETSEAGLAARETTLANAIEGLRNERDKGILQLRQSLEKERAAMATLKGAIAGREAALDAARQANIKAVQERNEAADQVKSISSSFERSTEDMTELAEAWPSYYRALANGARGIWNADAVPGAPAEAASAAIPPGVQISRYAGSWNFNFGLSTYRGPSPFYFDVVVRQANGFIFGTVNARFIVKAGSDPELRFTFFGPFQPGVRQAFPLETAEGATGTVELVPGTALNMLDVSYKLNGAAEKVDQAGAVLVKR